jgi:hypothetical protein
MEETCCCPIDPNHVFNSGLGLFINLPGDFVNHICTNLPAEAQGAKIQGPREALGSIRFSEAMLVVVPNPFHE